jgi:hypothetical protein
MSLILNNLSILSSTEACALSDSVSCLTHAGLDVLLCRPLFVLVGPPERPVDSPLRSLDELSPVNKGNFASPS